jgi:hypothetical protein
MWCTCAECPLRLWDLLDGDLVERDITVPDARLCDALGLYWCTVSDAELILALRLARDAAGTELLATPAETRDAERIAKEAALARVAELEAELERRR